VKKTAFMILWIAIALAGAAAYGTIAFFRGEHLPSAYILIAALCTYAIGYRFYSKWVAAKVLMLNDRRATPCEVHDDGKDFVKTNKWIVFGHHFAAISGPGPLVGPVLAAQFGYLPGTLWILIGVVLGGAVQDFVILFSSMRRNGRSLGQMVKDELNTPAGYVALVAILAIIVILLAVLGLVVVNALAESSWGVFTVAATIPIAMFMGVYLRYLRPGRVMEATVIGVILLLLAVYGGKLVHLDPAWSAAFHIEKEPLAWGVILYGLAASVLPVWLLLAPRDYLSTFMKLGTIFALALGILYVLPALQMPALTKFVDGSGLVFPGKLFPFCFITIACGAISGFHTLISSGTTPKIIARESHSRSIGYGAMCLESLVAIMAIIAACTLEPGVYLAMNTKGTPQEIVQKVTSHGFPVTEAQMDELAKTAGEKTLFARTGGATTLAVGMAHIFSQIVGGRGLDLWYHFAIMFEALFILTTIDAGTRVGRYLLQDFLGHIWKPLGNTQNMKANLLASILLVAGWGYFLIQGVIDPLGGINSLWPLFGIANQLLASIALCLATTIILKTHLKPGPLEGGGKRQPLYALVTLVPLIWLLSVTITASIQKIWSPGAGGFLPTAAALDTKLPALQQAVESARATGGEALATAEKLVRENRTLHFNNMLDAVVTMTFLVLVGLILYFTIREWILLIRRAKPPVTTETDPVWLPEEIPSPSLGAAGAAAIGMLLIKELSGEAAIDREMQRHVAESAASAQEHGDHEHVTECTAEDQEELREHAYLATVEHRFKGVTRCC